MGMGHAQLPRLPASRVLFVELWGQNSETQSSGHPASGVARQIHAGAQRRRRAGLSSGRPSEAFGGLRDRRRAARGPSEAFRLGL